MMNHITILRVLPVLALGFAVSTTAASAQTSSPAMKELRRLLGTENPIVKETQRVPRATLDQSVSLVAQSQTVTGGGLLLAFQTDESEKSPLAQVGGSLFAYLGKGKGSLPLRVTERVRYRAGTPDCGSIDYPGWAYAVTGLPAARVKALLQVKGHSSLFQGDDELPIFPWRLPSASPPLASAAERGRLEAAVRRIVTRAANDAVKAFGTLHDYGTPTEIRKRVMGPSGLSTFVDTAFAKVNVYAVRGPASSRLVFTSFTLNDDLADHGGDTKSALIAEAATGRVVSEAHYRYQILAVSDVDGDGVDEIITPHGVIHWDGRKWVWPVVQPVGMC